MSTDGVRVPGELLRHRLEQGVVYATWVKHPVGDHVELLGWAGFDCLILDMEHGLISPEAVPDLVRAAEVTGSEALVRLDRFDRALATRIMDSGAAGILVPDVQSREAADEAVFSVRYAPRGVRGASPTNRGARFGYLSFAEYRSRADAASIVIAQVEGPAGVAALDGILEVDGLGGVFIGPYDLSVHLGVPAELHHDRVLEAMRDICARALARGVMVCTWVPEADHAAEWIDLGVRLLTVSNSTKLLADAATAVLQKLPTPTRA